MYVQGDFKKCTFYSKKKWAFLGVFSGNIYFYLKMVHCFYSVSQKKLTFFFKKNTFKTSFAE